MSTYLLTFALLQNYTSKSIKAPNKELTIEVFGPISQIHNLTWILDESILAVEYMENVTKFKYPLKRLAFVIDLAFSGGMENFGLITLGNASAEVKNYDLLYHEIAHQWIGNILTLSDWKEICLQEGLTNYFEWIIAANFSRQLLEDLAQTEIEGYHEPHVKESQEIGDECYDRSAYLFYIIAMWDGFETMEKFLEKLIDQKAFSNANFDLWDATMNEMIINEKEKMKGYLKGIPKKIFQYTKK